MGGIFAAAAVIGLGAPAVRLLLSAWRERREVELWLGLAMGFAAVGLPMRMVSGVAISQHADQGLGISSALAVTSAAGHILTTFACVALYTFVWRVFHPNRIAVRMSLAVVFLALAAGLAWILATGAHLIERDPSILVSNVLRALVFPWCAFESTRYWRMMKRRTALGLADPVVTNRFALWAIWTGTFSALPIVVISAKVMSQMSGDAAGTLAMVLPIMRATMLCGVAAALVCIWLSFFPPHRYLAHLRSAPAQA